MEFKFIPFIVDDNGSKGVGEEETYHLSYHRFVLLIFTLSSQHEKQKKEKKKNGLRNHNSKKDILLNCEDICSTSGAPSGIFHFSGEDEVKLNQN